MHKLILLALLLLAPLLTMTAALVSAPARAQSVGDPLGLSPWWDWRTITTEHFRVTYPAELEDNAQKAANYLEEAHKLLSPKMQWEPRLRTQVLVIDNSDTANGLAAATGRFGVVIFATPPDNWFSTAYYDDWLRLVCLHEYTHILNMDATKGVYSILRIIFGDVILPNSLWPSWMLEGLAVYMETRHTKGGRGRSPYWEAILRSAVEDGTFDTGKFVTIDRMAGGTPWFPTGETAYMFGYQMMNSVSRAAGEEALGEMSIRSAYRFPFLINGNLENITDRDWYSYWDGWVKETRERMGRQLARIRAKPVTAVETLASGQNTLGSAVSPDGRLVAYTQDSEDRRMGLYVKNLETGDVRHVDDKTLGASLAFMPDSRRIVFSELHKQSNYYFWSDLAISDVDGSHRRWLTDRLRARDPDVSRDGKWITYTRTDHSGTRLELAALTETGDDVRLGEPRVLLQPAARDHLTTPKFSPDGKRVVFAIHRAGINAEDLMAVDLASGAVTTLVSDGKYNRYPAFNARGDVLFVSDATGVNNLYRLRDGGKPDAKPEMVTNVTTSLAFPTVAANGAIYASHLASTGWNLVRFAEPAVAVASVGDVNVLPPAAPALETAQPQNRHYESGSYSVWPSILPRQWAPFGVLRSDSFVVGGQVLGFDAVDRHRYLLYASYDSLVKRASGYGLYQNRSLGPTLSLSAETTSGSIYSSGSTVFYYDNRQELSASVMQPILFTRSALSPSLAFNAERTRTISPVAGDAVVFQRTYVPSADFTVAYSSAEYSRLAISPEGGRLTLLGTRVYFEPVAEKVWKGFLLDREHIRVTRHSVLVPQIKAEIVNRRTRYTEVRAEGPSDYFIGGNSADGYDQLAIRGYQGRYFSSKSVAIGSLDYRFPISWIYRGWGTNPAFLESLHGFVFGETSYFPEQIAGASYLPSAGAGLTASTVLLNNVPLNVSLEYHYGFKRSVGGGSVYLLTLGLGNLGI